MLIIGFVVLGFGVWGNTAPISGAVVTSGAFVATGQNKTVQHFEGGVIREILVREGDIVVPGQTLVILDDTAPRAELRRLELREARLSAIEARLKAEISDQDTLRFPPGLQSRGGDPEVATLLGMQLITFTARRNMVNSDVVALERAIDGIEERIRGTRTQLSAVERQAVLIAEELKGKEQLMGQGLIRRPEVLAIQRAHANLQGEVGRLIGELGDQRERIGRTREQIAGVRKTAVKAAVEQLHETGGELNDVRERMRTARGVLDRMRIDAPVRGSVVKLRYHTSGGVIEAGKAILEIVPLQDELIIEARVRPQDIDKVKRGKHAMVRLTALNQRITPMIAGEVIYLSADALPDERNRQPAQPSDLYVVRVRLQRDDVDTIPDFEPTPGMPAEIYIQTAERTFFEYLMQPLKDSMSRAFRER
ncbi:HlyD family type I secretion periplasmic adaptor subunit [Phreatobacter stygius]|uniref:Membrane fusion protein (MFP) family protein n=1 Tax=Phreatobacter stygius TaxID=1940610 RepID=A0A4D7BMP8_9HYPH|nr:HlyD family type I secretion periplasmic adaptor subunit [Phreatobacter stygius]